MVIYVFKKYTTPPVDVERRFEVSPAEEVYIPPKNFYLDNFVFVARHESFVNESKSCTLLSPLALGLISDHSDEIRTRTSARYRNLGRPEDSQSGESWWEPWKLKISL
jgi:hypothetical protein